MIRHPLASPLAPWFVALLPVDLADPNTRVNPGLVAGCQRASEALQFARRVDAALYARAHLDPDVAWIIEPSPRFQPPRWSESCPALEALQELEREDADASPRP